VQNSGRRCPREALRRCGGEGARRNPTRVGEGANNFDATPAAGLLSCQKDYPELNRTELPHPVCARQQTVVRRPALFVPAGSRAFTSPRAAVSEREHGFHP
jgi:hypothetical protein